MGTVNKILQPIIEMLNKQIAEKTPAYNLSKELEGKIISMKIKDTENHLNFIVT